AAPLGIATVCASCARNAASTGSRATSGSRYAAGFGTTCLATRARSVAAASDVSASMTANAVDLSCARADISTASAPRNGAAYLPVALTIGSVATAHGTSFWISTVNHGPEIAVAALPSLNSVATSGPSQLSGAAPFA